MKKRPFLSACIACLLGLSPPSPLWADAEEDCRQHGWRSMDLIVLHPNFPGLDALLEEFDRPHTHADDEVRLILAGEGLFGFFDATGQERGLHVSPGDYLRIPPGVERRFQLTPAKRIKALPLFADTSSWVAQYTQRKVPSLAGWHA